ncbi:hypothetical protein DERF_002618 [Dermatophagoides farinae]|uniref:Uncharacterized protein n=1 Tax=Dermatophagoides farinae TaxID=6954 RepID=A0A922LAS9_DERFA|nr:hypothetical protein DERF_002618 [Dermatophagoides farinae]
MVEKDQIPGIMVVDNLSSLLIHMKILSSTLISRLSSQTYLFNERGDDKIVIVVAVVVDSCDDYDDVI